MPVRIRKSFKLFPGVKVNMSKGGVSFTVGAKGYHLNFSKRGVRQTVGLPGSGISETSYLIKNDPETSTKKKSDTKARDDESDVEKVTDDEEIEHPVTSKRRAPVWVLLFGLAVIYFGAIFLGLIPNNFLSQLFHTLTEWSRGLGL
jgi:hypothetical protein